MFLNPQINSKTYVYKQTRSAKAIFARRIWLSFLVLILLAAPLAAGILHGSKVTATHNDISFEPVVNYATPGSVSYDGDITPITVDINNDDNLDIVAVSYTTDNFSVFIGNGDGTFDAAVNYAAVGATIVGTGDFNNDDNADLILLNDDRSDISILIGNGDGTFDAAVDYAVGNSPFMHPLLADFNNDDNLDIVVNDSGDDKLYVLIGNGDGTFDAAVDYAVSDAYSSPFTEDFNNDNNLDLVISNTVSASVSVLIGNGDGTFDAAVDYVVGDSPYYITGIGDFNNDNIIDLATANSGSDNVSVLIGEGDGTFGATEDFAAGRGVYGPAIADLNDDGNEDIVTSNHITDNFSILLGNGDGTFDVTVNYSANIDLDYSIPILDDFNSDGILDILGHSTGDDSITILLGNGDGTFETGEGFTTGNRPLYSVATADFNNDGLPDVLAPVEGHGTAISILINNTALPEVEFASSSGSGLESVTSPSIPVNLSVATDVDVTVHYVVSGGTATGGGTDFTLAAGDLTIPDGDTTANIPLAIVSESIIEGDETVIITLSSPVSAILGSPTSFTYTITDDDSVSSGSSSGSRSNKNSSVPNTPGLQFPLNYQYPTSNPSNPYSSTGVTLIAPAIQFLRNLGFGSMGNDVKALQQFLNLNQFIVSPSGAGSPGQETTYYGPRTAQAVKIFQETFASQILTPLGLISGTGFFGPSTRAFVNSLL